MIDLRQARLEDSAWTFAWRNHPDVRRHFHDPRALEQDTHERWWRAVVAAPDRHLLIALSDSVAVGVLRLDEDGEEAEVSIYLDPERTGRGLGRQILEAGARWAAKRTALQRLTASIKDRNLASIGAFERAGFKREGSRWVKKLHP